MAGKGARKFPWNALEFIIYCVTRIDSIGVIKNVKNNSGIDFANVKYQFREFRKLSRINFQNCIVLRRIIRFAYNFNEKFARLHGIKIRINEIVHEI